jgi:hypothetical protein
MLALERSLRSGVINQNKINCSKLQRRHARPSSAPTVINGCSYMATPGAAVYDQHDDSADNATTSRFDAPGLEADM